MPESDVVAVGSEILTPISASAASSSPGGAGIAPPWPATSMPSLVSVTGVPPISRPVIAIVRELLESASVLSVRPVSLSWSAVMTPLRIDRSAIVAVPAVVMVSLA